MKHYPAILRGLLVLAGLALAAGCNSSDKKPDAPAKLEEFKPTAQVRKAWSASVGGGEPKLRLGLGLALDGNRVFAAGYNGNIAAYDVKIRQAAVGHRHQTAAVRRAGRGRRAGGGWYQPRRPGCGRRCHGRQQVAGEHQQ